MRGDGDSLNNAQKMKTLKQFKEDGYSICLPQKPKLDMGIINKLQCQLKCPLESRIILHVVSAYDYLMRGVSIVDDNGELVTSLDDDLEKKLVIVGKDLNLWYALQQFAIKDEEIGIEIVSYRYLKF